MNKPLWLRIDKQESLQGDLIEITWEPIFELVDLPAVKEYRKKCDKNVYDYTMNSFRSEMRVGEKVNLKIAGNTLFNNFVDEDFYNRHRKECHEIYISTRMIYVPWELVTYTDGDEKPWGIKFSIGNQVRSPLDVREKKIPEFKEQIDVLLIAANTREDLMADKEIEVIKESLLQNDRIRCEILVMKPPMKNSEKNVEYFQLDYNMVLRKLQDSKFDIIHYAGHIEPPDDKNLGSALVLEKKGRRRNKLLYSKIIYSNLGGMPFVFLNGCSMLWKDAPLVISNIADGFILGGARGVLVPRTPIEDEDAMRIAVSFYKHVLNGKTFGEALRSIREEEFNKDSDNINWLTYILFGKPGARLFSLEKELFLSDTHLKARILNERIFEDDSINLIRKSSFCALGCNSDRVEIEHMVTAFTNTELFAALFADQAKDDLWRVLKEFRMEIMEEDINFYENQKEYENLPIKEDLMSPEILDILKKGHSLCEQHNLPKIRLIDLLQASMEVKKENLDIILKVVAEKSKLTKLSSVMEIKEAIKNIRFKDKMPESLTMNLFTIDGYINRNFVTKKAKKIFAKCAIFQSIADKKLLPEDLFYISGLLPEMNTNNFFTKEKFELGEFGEDIRDTLLQVGERELELTAEKLHSDTENVLKNAANIARWESTKLGEKHLIRSIIDFAIRRGGEEFPPEDFLEKLELDTIEWKEN